MAYNYYFMEKFMIQMGKIGDSGRVVIPAIIRKYMQVNSGDNIIFSYKEW